MGIDIQLVWCVAEQLTPQTTDREVWDSSLARRVVSLPLMDKELYSTVALFTQVYKRVLPGILLGGVEEGGNPAIN